MMLHGLAGWDECILHSHLLQDVGIYTNACKNAIQTSGCKNKFILALVSDRDIILKVHNFLVTFELHLSRSL